MEFFFFFFVQKRISILNRNILMLDNLSFLVNINICLMKMSKIRVYLKEN